MRTMIFVLASMLVAVANEGLAYDPFYFYGQPPPVYYAQPQPVVVFGQPTPASPYASPVVYFGLTPMPNYTFPVTAFGGYGPPQVPGPYLAGYWPQPIYYSAPLTPPGMLGAPLGANPYGKLSTMRW